MSKSSPFLNLVREAMDLGQKHHLVMGRFRQILANAGTVSGPLPRSCPSHTADWTSSFVFAAFSFGFKQCFKMRLRDFEGRTHIKLELTTVIYDAGVRRMLHVA